MDKQERDRLRALCEKATAGPWFGESSTDAYYRLTAISPDRGHSDLLAEFHHPQKFVDGKRVVDDARKAEVIWNLAFSSEARTALPAALDALDAAEAKEARLVEHLSRTQQACAIFERNSADVAEMWERVKKAEAERDALRAKLDAAEAEVERLTILCDRDKSWLDLIEDNQKLATEVGVIRRTTVEAIVRRLRELGGETAHPESCVGYYRAANIVEREFLTEKGGA